ncbi:NADP-dependent oxidoreductase [Chryseosolibacter indicus]|uniref:NADP-dependent oxidoreductase n=1 Tax=Chryseosolibacter indicus TaxID=2782351 RepID=A0ABS5VMV1_9BACT|nr:NADP-dependent oxidoreductase [Chryseosolibacter indicus]MBT1702170.1 NADP-dependent oxidoreductase [Chryseosolibacter indicus]
MKAIIIQDFGGVDKLVTTDVTTPSIKNDEVLVQVKAISINPVDVKSRASGGVLRTITERPLILGWDIAGIVVEVGGQVKNFKKGDSVFGMVNFPGHAKAYAEFVTAPASHLTHKPANISFEEAAAATLAALTAWQAFTVHAKVTKGDKVLIHAASGGVGHYAVQLAKHFGAYVIGTSSAKNRDFVLNLGADEHLDYQTKPFEESVADVDVVLDSLGPDNLKKSITVTRKGGTVVSILGFAEHLKDEAKNKGVNGKPFLVSSNGNDMEALADLMARGILRSHVSKTFTFNQMRDAHLEVESGRVVGKVVVTL